MSTCIYHILVYLLVFHIIEDFFTVKKECYLGHPGLLSAFFVLGYFCLGIKSMLSKISTS